MTELEFFRGVVGAIIVIAFMWKYTEMLLDTSQQPRHPFQILINVGLLLLVILWFSYLAFMAGLTNKP